MRWLARGGRFPWHDRPVPGVEDTGLVGWAKNSQPRAPGQAPGRGAPAWLSGPGHRRGGHMVIDTWECGCIYTWTRAAGWVHNFNCLDAELERLLST